MGGLILAYSSINLCKTRFYAIVHALSINTGTDTMSKRINNKRGAGNPRQTKTIKLRREHKIAEAKAKAKGSICGYCEDIHCELTPEGIPGCGLGADKYCI